MKTDKILSKKGGEDLANYKRFNTEAVPTLTYMTSSKQMNIHRTRTRTEPLYFQNYFRSTLSRVVVFNKCCVPTKSMRILVFMQRNLVTLDDEFVRLLS